MFELKNRVAPTTGYGEGNVGTVVKVWEHTDGNTRVMVMFDNENLHNAIHLEHNLVAA